jgi:ATP-dependent Clp protease protease subunit
LIDILAKHTGQEKKRITRDTERDYYLSSEEAKEYGIVDTTMEKRNLDDNSNIEDKDG